MMEEATKLAEKAKTDGSIQKAKKYNKI